MYNQFSSYPSSHHHNMSAVHGHPLEVTVVGCNKLKDTEWISRQDPYVCLEYGSTKYRTRTSTDGGKNPIFQEKFTFSMIEGLRELNVVVWNSNTITFDDFIGSGKIQLQKVLSEGYDDSSWPIQTKTGRHAGEVRLILHYANARKQATGYAPSAPPFVTPSAPQAPLYSTPLPAVISSYPPQPPAYTVQSSYAAYPPHSGAYPPPAYPPANPSAYPPSYGTYPPPSTYPPPRYPPPPHVPAQYPPPPHVPAQYPPPPGPYPGMYPPPY